MNESPYEARKASVWAFCCFAGKISGEKNPPSNVWQTARRVTRRVIQQKFLKYSKIPALKNQKENRPFIE